MDALAGEGIEIGGEGGDEGLALTGAHLGDGAGVEHHAAHQLDVEVTHVVGALGSLADNRESFFEQAVERGAVGKALAEFLSLALQRLVGQGLHDRLKRVDPVHPGAEGLEFPVVRGSENLAGNSKHMKQHQPVSGDIRGRS